MPQIEILADTPSSTGQPGASECDIQRAENELADQVAACLAGAYGISTESVGVSIASRVQGGATEPVTGRTASGSRAWPNIFVKVHALKREPALRSRFAGEVTPVLARHYATDMQFISIYFFERTTDEIALGGRLMSDR